MKSKLNARSYQEQGDEEALCPTCGGLIHGLPVCWDLKQAVPAHGEPCWFLEKALEGYREERALQRAKALVELCNIKRSTTAKEQNAVGAQGE